MRPLGAFTRVQKVHLEAGPRSAATEEPSMQFMPWKVHVSIRPDSDMFECEGFQFEASSDCVVHATTGSAAGRSPSVTLYDGASPQLTQAGRLSSNHKAVGLGTDDADFEQSFKFDTDGLRALVELRGPALSTCMGSARDSSGSSVSGEFSGSGDEEDGMLREASDDHRHGAAPSEATSSAINMPAIDPGEELGAECELGMSEADKFFLAQGEANMEVLVEVLRNLKRAAGYVTASPGHGDSDMEHHNVLAPHIAEDVTTLMFDIPCRFTQQAIMDVINDAGFEDTYDFLYVPFRNRSNRGYAYVNFMDHKHAVAFAKMFMNHRFTGNSEKKCIVKAADTQGREANINRNINSQTRPYIREVSDGMP